MRWGAQRAVSRDVGDHAGAGIPITGVEVSRTRAKAAPQRVTSHRDYAYG